MAKSILSKILYQCPSSNNNLADWKFVFLGAFDLPALKDKGIVLDFLEIGNEGDLYM